MPEMALPAESGTRDAFVGQSSADAQGKVAALPQIDGRATTKTSKLIKETGPEGQRVEIGKNSRQGGDMKSASPIYRNQKNYE